MQVAIATKRLANLIADYGYPLEVFFDCEKLNSILSPEDVYIHNMYVLEVKYGECAQTWLKHLVNVDTNNTYSYVPNAFTKVCDERYPFNGKFESKLVAQDKILIIMDTQCPLGQKDTEPFRELLTHLIEQQGMQALNAEFLPLYINAARFKPIV